MTPRSGFTLVEMALTLAGLSLAALAVPPAIQATLDTMRLKNGARDIANILQTARMQAVNEGTSVRMVFSVEDDTYLAQRQSGTTWQSIGCTHELPAGIDLKSVSANPTFASSGRVDNPPTIVLENQGGRETTISVSIAGRVKVH